MLIIIDPDEHPKRRKDAIRVRRAIISVTHIVSLRKMKRIITANTMRQVKATNMAIPRQVIINAIKDLSANFGDGVSAAVFSPR
jgi:hypothetical protein